MILDSLLTQEIGFFDTTKTGDISSRMSNDTTLVGDTVTLNVNVFLRSLVQAVGVLIFMFTISWQLCLVAFLSVPCITILSKSYGEFMKQITKHMQNKLADGCAVSESAINSITTVRSFGAEESELKDFISLMDEYLRLNHQSALAYCGYATCVTSLPQLVTIVVLFFGSLLVLYHHPHDESSRMTSGQLVSFLLYLNSLSDAFNSIGNVWAALSKAIGAADHVFELIHRSNQHKISNNRKKKQMGTVGRTREFRRCGLNPTMTQTNGLCEVKFDNIDMYYPARPTKQVLNQMSLEIPSGCVCALVGPSGGGKSSILSLLQGLYVPSQGTISIGDHDVSK